MRNFGDLINFNNTCSYIMPYKSTRFKSKRHSAPYQNRIIIMEVAGTVKAMVIGAACSGKTCLISRLVDEKLPQTYQRTAELFSSTMYNTRHGDQGKIFLVMALFSGCLLCVPL